MVERLCFGGVNTARQRYQGDDFTVLGWEVDLHPLSRHWNAVFKGNLSFGGFSFALVEIERDKSYFFDAFRPFLNKIRASKQPQKQSLEKIEVFWGFASFREGFCSSPSQITKIWSFLRKKQPRLELQTQLYCPGNLKWGLPGAPEAQISPAFHWKEKSKLIWASLGLCLALRSPNFGILPIWAQLKLWIPPHSSSRKILELLRAPKRSNCNRADGRL